VKQSKIFRLVRVSEVLMMANCGMMLVFHIISILFYLWKEFVILFAFICIPYIKQSLTAG